MEWWLDSGATRHVPNKISIFATFKEESDSQEIFVENELIAEVKGIRNIHLKFTSDKKITLTEVLCVPKICKNSMSTSLLSKDGFKVVIESDKVVITKGGVFVGNGFVCNRMFKFMKINSKRISLHYEL